MSPTPRVKSPGLRPGPPQHPARGALGAWGEHTADRGQTVEHLTALVQVSSAASQPSRLQSSCHAPLAPSSSHLGGPVMEAPLWTQAHGLERHCGWWGCAGGLRGGPRMALRRGGAAFPGDTEEAGAVIRVLYFIAFSAQAGCRKWRASGFRDYLLLFKGEKKTNP